MTEFSLTERLARFAASPLADPPYDAIVIAKSGFADTIATMLAGREAPVVGIVRRFVAARQSGCREACLLLGAEHAASADAALVNGTSAHALDYDDVALGGHPSTVLVPAARPRHARERARPAGNGLVHAWHAQRGKPHVGG